MECCDQLSMNILSAVRLVGQVITCPYTAEIVTHIMSDSITLSFIQLLFNGHITSVGLPILSEDTKLLHRL